MNPVLSILILSFMLLGQNANKGEFVWDDEKFYSWFDEQSQEDTVLINFWATWCRPCVEEMPDLLAVSEESGIKTYFFSIDDSDIADKVLSFVETKGWKGNFNLIDVVDFDKFINHIDSTWEGAIPMTILIRNGTKKSHYNKFENKDEIRNFLNN